MVWCDKKGECGGWYMVMHRRMMERYYGGEV